jgi:hypothetical protein
MRNLVKNKQFIILLIFLIGLSGCITEKSKGYNETGYLDSYFEHPKLGWILNETYYIYETQGIDAARSFIASDPNNIVERDSIDLRIIVTEINQTNLNILKSIGVNVTFVSPEGNDLNAWVPIPKIHDLGELEFIDMVYPEEKPQKLGD